MTKYQTVASCPVVTKHTSAPFVNPIFKYSHCNAHTNTYSHIHTHMHAHTHTNLKRNDFGCHEVRRANGALLLLCAVSRRRVRLDLGRDAKVGQLRNAVLVDENVGALDIAMNHTLFVQVLESVEHHRNVRARKRLGKATVLEVATSKHKSRVKHTGKTCAHELLSARMMRSAVQ